MTTKTRRFEALVHAWSAELYRYGYWLCNEHGQAEDLVQETYLRAWRSLSSLRDEKSARSWLYTILRREHARQYEKLRPPLDDLDSVELIDPVALESTVDDLLLRQALWRLPDAYREPLVLQVLAGFSAAEIASIMELSSNTVLTRLFRARKKLQKLFETSQSQPNRRNA